MKSSSMTGIRTCCALMSAAVVAGSPLAREDPVPSELRETVEVRLIQLTVLAVDADGRPVTDLEPDEIVVKDKGKRYVVEFLDPVEIPEVPAVRARLFVNVPGGPSRPVPTGGGARDHFLLFLDIENEPPLGRKEYREGALRFARDGFDASFQVAVMSYDGEINTESPFTTDREVMLQAVEAAYRRRGRPKLSRVRAMRNLITRIASCADRVCINDATASYALEVRSHGEDFIRALEGVVRYASGLEGRKVVMAVSAGASLNPSYEINEAIRYARGNFDAPPAHEDEGSANLTRLDALAQLANRHDVTLHFVSRPPEGLSSFAALARPSASPGADPIGASFAQAHREMSQMARATGGRLEIREDTDRGLDDLLWLERQGYRLGYYLDAAPRPDEVRRVNVACTRPGVEILVPRSYYRGDGTKKKVETTMSLSDRPSVFPDGRRRIPFTIEVDPRSLGYRVKGGEARTDFTLATTLRLEDGRTLASTYHFVRHAYDKKQWKKKDIEPLAITGWVEVPPGSYEVAVEITNPRSQRLGRISRPLVVPRVQLREAGSDGP